MWSDGLANAASGILQATRPDLIEEWAKEIGQVAWLEPIKESRQLVALLGETHAMSKYLDIPESKDEMELLKEFMGFLEVFEIWAEIDFGAQVEAEYSLQKLLHRLSAAGWFVSGARRLEKAKTVGFSVDTQLDCAYLAVTKGEHRAISVSEGKFLVINQSSAAE